MDTLDKVLAGEDVQFQETETDTKITKAVTDTDTQKERALEGSDSESSESESDSGDESVDGNDVASEIDEDEDDGTSSNSAPRTKNEVEYEPIPSVPTEFKLTPDMPIEYVGTLVNVMCEERPTDTAAQKKRQEVTAVIQAASSGEFRVLSESSILCFEDRQLLGLVFETFGRVQQPMYSVKFSHIAGLEEPSGNEEVPSVDVTCPELSVVSVNEVQVAGSVLDDGEGTKMEEAIDVECAKVDKVDGGEHTNMGEVERVEKTEQDEVDIHIETDQHVEPAITVIIGDIHASGENLALKDDTREDAKVSQTAITQKSVFADRIGSAVYYVVPQSSFTLTETARAIKGSDASNMHDEELPEEEQEFSDDEAELLSKSNKKRSSKAKKNNNSNNSNNNNNNNSKTRQTRNKKRKLENSTMSTNTKNNSTQRSSVSNFTPQQMSVLQMPWLPQQYSAQQFHRSNLPYDAN